MAKSKYTLKQIDEWKKKAERWDALDEKISKFYCNTEGEIDEDNPENKGDLLDIGEIAARAFNWI
jgi:hypothetical protein